MTGITHDLFVGSWNGALEVDTFLDHVELLFVMMEGDVNSVSKHTQYI
jgi:hypothetical protein